MPPACRSSVGTVLETLLPDPPQWSLDPVTKRSSNRKQKDKGCDEAVAASTSARAGSTDNEMMVFDEELGEFVPAVTGVTPTANPPPSPSNDRRTNNNSRGRKRKRSVGRPPTHNGRKQTRRPRSGDVQPRRRSPRNSPSSTGGAIIPRRSPRNSPSRSSSGAIKSRR